MIECIAEKISSARKEIKWYSDELGTGFFDRPELFQAFKHFLVQTHPLKLTLIARQVEIAHSHHHTLIPLFQRLSSKVEIRNIATRQANISFLLIDKKILIKQALNTSQSKNIFEISTLDRAQQKLYLERFEKHYKDSQLSHNLRQLSL
jgi:hypothetical protein